MLLSKTCVKMLLRGFNKHKGQLQICVDERDITRWKYLDNDPKLGRVEKNIKKKIDIDILIWTAVTY